MIIVVATYHESLVEDPGCFMRSNHCVHFAGGHPIVFQIPVKYYEIRVQRCNLIVCSQCGAAYPLVVPH